MNVLRNMGLSKVEPQCQAAAAVRLVVEGTLENSLSIFFSPHNNQSPPPNLHHPGHQTPSKQRA